MELNKLIEHLEKLTEKKVLLEEPILFGDLEQIAKEVYRKYPLINKGGCAQFALAINRVLGLDKFLLLYETEDSKDFGLASHVCIDLGNGKAYDAEGIWSLGQLKQNYEGETALIIEKADLNDVIEYSSELGNKYDQNELETFIKTLN